MAPKGIFDLIGINKLFSSNNEPERTIKSYTMIEQLRDYLDTEVKPKYGLIEELGPVQISG